jgi:FAD/FMN-containing dehydrogenase
VYEPDIAALRAGDAAEVTLDYAPGPPYEGKIAYVYPFVDDKTRAIRVRIELKNRDLQLRPGMFATVHLARDLGPRLQIPAEAVVYTGTRRLVFVDLGRDRFKPVEVRLGARAESFVEVLDGLKAGQVVATSGVFLLASEARIATAAKLWEPMDAADAGAPETSAPPVPPPHPPAPRAPTSTTSSSIPSAAPSQAVWTCPMHPEIESATSGKCPKCGMDLVPKEGKP